MSLQILNEHFLGFFVWDPDRNFFVIPILEHPVTWYGFLFAFGFLVGYFLVRRLFEGALSGSNFSSKELKTESTRLADRLTFLVIVGTIIGARLGHVFFYDWSYYSRHPEDIFKVWEGGLASHGGALGILLALLVFTIWNQRSHSKVPKWNFLTVLDVVVVPTAFVGGCIRVGNFINQEILGIPTQVPWAVIFLHPIEGPAGVPVHPVQLYEALLCFTVFLFLMFLWRKNEKTILGTGKLSGWFLTLIFGLRFFLEFFKMPESDLLPPDAPLRMGQILSLPFAILGLILLFFAYRKKAQ